MAGKNERAVNGQGKTANPPTDPPGARGVKLANDLRALGTSLQELVKSTDGLQECGSILEAKESLEKKLRDSQTEVTRLRKEKRDIDERRATETREARIKIEASEAHTSRLHEEYGRKYTEWDKSRETYEETSNELSRARAQLTEAKDAAATATAEIQALQRSYSKQKKDLEEARKRYTSCQEELQFQDVEIKKLQRRLEQAVSEKQRAVEHLGMVPLDRASVSESMGILANRIHQIAEFVGNELPDPSATVHLTETFPIRVPSSNSRPARYMRRAVAESLIAAELRRSVFLDIYNGGVDLLGINLGELRSSLLWLEKNEREEEADVIRCQLTRALAAYAPDSSVQAKELAVRVVDALTPWIPDEQTRTKFEGGLAGILEDSIKLWQSVQKAEKRVAATFILDTDSWDAAEDRRLVYDGVPAGGQAREPGPESLSDIGDPIAVLFPHIHTADGEIFCGWALFQNQLMVAEAYRELQAQQASSNAGGPFRRRLSMREPPVSRNRRVSASFTDEARLRRASVGLASDPPTSQQRSPVGPVTTASVSPARNQRPGPATNGRHGK